MALNSSRGAQQTATGSAGSTPGGAEKAAASPPLPAAAAAGGGAGAPPTPAGASPAPAPSAPEDAAARNARRAASLRKTAEEAWADFAMGPSADMERTLLAPLTAATGECWDDPKALEKAVEGRLSAVATASASVALRADFLRRRVAAVADAGTARRAPLRAVAAAARNTARRAKGHSALCETLLASAADACAAISVSADKADAQSARIAAVLKALDLPGKEAAVERVAGELEGLANAAEAAGAADRARKSRLRDAAKDARRLINRAVTVANRRAARRAGDLRVGRPERSPC